VAAKDRNDYEQEIPVRNESWNIQVGWSTKPVLAYFWDPRSDSCLLSNPVISRLATELRKKAKVVKIDITQEIELAKKYAVDEVPRVILFKDGKMFEQITGQQELHSKCNELIKRNMSEISSAIHVGGRRDQEDRLVVRRVCAGSHTGVLLAIADGHGADDTSSYVHLELSNGIFDKFLSRTQNPIDALNRTFEHLNENTLEMFRKSGAHAESGTTLSIVYVADSSAKTTTAYVGVIGDSPVICRHKDGALEILPEHNARSNERERKAAEDRGGIFENGYIRSSLSDFGLQMTRDIGCHTIGNVLGRSPDVYVMSIHEGDIVMIGSDGLLDPLHQADHARQEMQRLADLAFEGAEANELIEDALKRETEDNISAIVYRR